MADAAYEVRTIDRLIACLNHGDDASEANRLYRQIMEALRNNVNDYGGKHKAQLALTFDFQIDAKGAVDVALASKAKMPPKPVNRERFFIAPDDVLTLQDPMRDSLFPGIDAGRRRAPETGDQTA